MLCTASSIPKAGISCLGNQTKTLTDKDEEKL